VTLQVYALNPDGSQKLNVTGGTVRVYWMNAGSEQVVLAPTALVNISNNLWRYNWAPASLPVREYVAEYTLTDGTKTTRISEDLVVRDIATETRLIATQADIEIIKKVETGRWKIVSNQMIFYDDDGVTPLLTFNLFDQVGLPSMDSVFERVLVP
jgi:hypothetical protein